MKIEGEEVTLKWNGCRNLPKFLHHTKATIVKITRQGNYIVQPKQAEGTYRVYPSQVI